MQMKKLIVELSNERLITPSGLALVGGALGKSDLVKRANLGEPYDTIIELYHAHGESEQYHSEIKTDMDVERLPSGKFDTNELVLELTVLAYNILRIIGQNSLKSKRAPETKRPVKRRRIRTVINNLILIAGHVTEHARRVVLSLGCSNIWRHVFLDLYRLLVA